MKRRILVAVLAAMVLSMSPAIAQDDRVYTSHDDDDWGEKESRFSLAIGGGLVNVRFDEPELGSISDTYWMAAFRIRFGKETASHGSKEAGFRGYIEPEIGYWGSNNTRYSGGGRRTDYDTSDFLFGVNIIGVLPVNAVEFFLGAGAGIHFIDSTVQFHDGAQLDLGEDAFGVNAQFGLDVHATKMLSIFGAGRFDIIDSEIFNANLKAYLGLRFNF